MKTIWMEGESLDDWPPGRKAVAMRVESAGDGFWCYYKGRRTAGSLPETPLHEILRWLLEQVNLGFVKYIRDEAGDIVSVVIGQSAHHAARSAEEAAQTAAEEGIALNIVGLLAEAREKGSDPKSIPLQEKLWQQASVNMHTRMAIHYALVLARLLRRVSKKVTRLELMPMMKDAPDQTRDYLAEATRCYLLRLNRACIAMCRACLEDTLKAVLTEKMKDELREIVQENKRQCRSGGEMFALIDVCGRHGVLLGHERDAHDVREAGNRVLHLTDKSKSTDELAGEVLGKTRTIIGLINGRAKVGLGE